MRRGFTLIELLITMAIIFSLMGMVLYALAVGDDRERATTRTLLLTVNQGMNAHDTTTIHADNGSGVYRSHTLWDFNGDGILDGDPSKDPNFSSSDRAAAYRGPLATLGLNISPRQQDKAGRILDAWRQPLRVSTWPPEGGSLQAWSTGPDKQMDTPTAIDDVKLWTSSRSDDS